MFRNGEKEIFLETWFHFSVRLVEFVLEVKVISTSSIGESVQQSEEAGGDVCARISFVRSDPRRHLNNEGGSVHHRWDDIVHEFLKDIRELLQHKRRRDESYAQNPIDGELQSFFDAQKVDEWPKHRRDEVDNHHEQEEVRRSAIRWRS